MRQQDHTESASKNWLSDTRESRRRARRGLMELPADIQSRLVVYPPESQRVAHKALLDYHSHLAVKDGATNGLWTEHLATVAVPTGGTVDAGRTNVYGDLDLDTAVDHVDWRELDVSLATLASQFDEANGIRIEVLADGDYHHTERVTYYTPPIVIKRAFRQLDAVLNDLGWVPEAATRERRATDTEVLTHE